jgi:repressor LexA
MSEPLSTLERRVYHYLLDFLAEHSFQPSVREIGKRFRIRSTKTVSDLLAALAAKGYIKREAGRSRGVTLVGIAGSPGTQPLAAYETPPGPSVDATHFLTLDRRLVPADECFLLRLDDSGLSARGFLAGDYAIVNPSARAHDGDIVAVRLGAKGVGRILSRKGAVVTFTALDPDLANLSGGATDDIAILGVIVGSIRVPGGVIAPGPQPMDPTATH